MLEYRYNLPIVLRYCQMLNGNPPPLLLQPEIEVWGRSIQIHTILWNLGPLSKRNVNNRLRCTYVAVFDTSSLTFF